MNGKTLISVMKIGIKHGMVFPLLIVVGIISSIFQSLFAADGNFYLSFPLKEYTPYNIPVSSVFDHHIGGTVVESMTSEQRFKYDGAVVAYTGEKGVGTAIKNGGYQQQNGYIFRLHGNYVGVGGKKNYLEYDGHPGYDYAVETGTNVYAAADGKVIKVDPDGGTDAGKYVIIEHKSGNYQTTYLHLNEVKVGTGTEVLGGVNIVGKSGNTGASTGAHLHFEVKKITTGGEVLSIDPYGWEGSGILWSQSATTCSDEYEINDSFNKATKTISGSSYTCKICNSGDGDYFKIDVANAGAISLQLTMPSSKNYELELYDASFVKRDGSFNGAGISESITYSAPTGGIYYIRIYGFKGDYDIISTYSLSGTWPSADINSITHTLTPPSKTTVSQGGVLGPFTVEETNNSDSYYAFYLQPYVSAPDGTTVNLGQLSTSLKAGETRRFRGKLQITLFLELGTYTFTFGVKLTDTSGNLIDNDSFEFTVVSSTSYAMRRSARKLKRLMRNPEAQVMEEDGWKVVIVPEKDR